MASIKIFDIVLNGVDCERFCAMDKPSQIEYIQKHSLVKDEAKIREFLKLPPKQFVTGCCGFTKAIENGGNITSGNEQEAEQVDASETTTVDVSGDQGGRDDASSDESAGVPERRKTDRKINRKL